MTEELNTNPTTPATDTPVAPVETLIETPTTPPPACYQWPSAKTAPRFGCHGHPLPGPASQKRPSATGQSRRPGRSLHSSTVNGSRQNKKRLKWWKWADLSAARWADEAGFWVDSW